MGELVSSNCNYHVKATAAARLRNRGSDGRSRWRISLAAIALGGADESRLWRDAWLAKRKSWRGHRTTDSDVLMLRCVKSARAERQ